MRIRATPANVVVHRLQREPVRRSRWRDDVTIPRSNEARHLVRFTAPAPNKFLSGAQLSRGFHPFIVSNMRAEVNWVGVLRIPNPQELSQRGGSRAPCHPANHEG